MKSDPALGRSGTARCESDFGVQNFSFGQMEIRINFGLQGVRMIDTTQPPPKCFGDLQTVFPLRSDGLRVTPISCLQCIHKTPCLRQAMERRSGLRVREEMLERAYRGGMVGFFQRWSQKKTLHRMKKENSDKPTA